MYYIYVLRCGDNSLYTGITNDFGKRFALHTQRDKAAAKYTKSRQVVKAELLWTTATKSNALKLEIKIKKLTKQKKENLALNPGLFREFFPELEGEYVQADPNAYIITD